MAPAASRTVRRTHLYLALFLTPWMIIYALSGIILNRFDTVRNLWGGKYSDFEKVAERTYTAAFAANATPRQIGGQVLADLGLAGSFNVEPGSNAARLVVVRSEMFSAHRVTYFRPEHRVLIERLRFDAPVAINRAHFRHGYGHPGFAGKVWGGIVDLAVVGMVFWAVSGLLMWWEIRPARIWGALCLVTGSGIFGVLLATI